MFVIKYVTFNLIIIVMLLINLFIRAIMVLFQLPNHINRIRRNFSLAAKLKKWS